MMTLINNKLISLGYLWLKNTVLTLGPIAEAQTFSASFVTTTKQINHMALWRKKSSTGFFCCPSKLYNNCQI